MPSSLTLESSPLLAPQQRKRSRTTLILILAALALPLSELVCRFVIGLGDPPLYQTDRYMEYRLQPSKTYYRFHKRFSVNGYSMRADDFPPKKAIPNELRVLVVGDSVIYGGVRIDQNNIDTEILKRNLQSEFHRPVTVGNAAAKSWGPPNEFGYLQVFGTLDADVVILELSSHDYADAPTYVPVVGISADYPDKKPTLALFDLFETYLLPRYLHIGLTPPGVDKTLLTSSSSEQDITACRDAERNFFRFARTHGAGVALMQHLTMPEVNGGYQAGYFANRSVAQEENVPHVDDSEDLRAHLNSGQNPFYPGDTLHVNDLGQTILAGALQKAVELALKTQ
jgi:hypothetical protein